MKYNEIEIVFTDPSYSVPLSALPLRPVRQPQQIGREGSHRRRQLFQYKKWKGWWMGSAARASISQFISPSGSSRCLSFLLPLIPYSSPSRLELELNRFVGCHPRATPML